MKFERKRVNDPGVLVATTPSGLVEITAERKGKGWQLTGRFGGQMTTLCRNVSRGELQRAAETFTVRLLADAYRMIIQDSAAARTSLDRLSKVKR